uniref:Uncharacterized protein n=1 Tax=Capitella teleta TaxID=283909 RepID=X2AC79_CAPTE
DFQRTPSDCICVWSTKKHIAISVEHSILRVRFRRDLFNGILYLGYDMVVSAVPSTNCSYKLLAVDSEVFVEMDQTFRDQPLLDREARTVAKDVDYLFPRMVYVSMYDFQSGIQPQIKTSFTHPKTFGQRVHEIASISQEAISEYWRSEVRREQRTGEQAHPSLSDSNYLEGTDSLHYLLETQAAPHPCF